jgi:hypothetical protein
MPAQVDFNSFRIADFQGYAPPELLPSVMGVSALNIGILESCD